MIYPVKYSDRAIETFDAISEQIELRWGLRHLFIFEERTLKVIDTIRESPFIFQAIEANPKVRKAFIHKNCSMFYRVGSTYIEVRRPCWCCHQRDPRVKYLDESFRLVI